MFKVSVIGAAGRVGWPFSLVLAETKHNVVGIDRNNYAVNSLINKEIIHREKLSSQIIEKLDNFYPKFTTSDESLKDSDIVCIMIGTPMDEEGNPRTTDIFNFFDSWYEKYPQSFKGKTIILRSTVSPGTTDVLKEKICSLTGLTEGKDFILAFCPERVTEGNSIEETKNLPALIGTYSDFSYQIVSKFFKTFVTETIKLSPTEAELAKLMTNMYRYVNFAFANECKMISDNFGIDVNKVINAVNKDYGRANIPQPGFAAGPCLGKDGKFLLQEVPYTELIKTATEINEGLPGYLWNQIKNRDIHKVLLLGAGFKKDSDDMRLSLTFKMKKILQNHGLDVWIYDPYIKEYADEPNWSEFDTFIVMSPHTDFIENVYPNLLKYAYKNAILVDYWKQSKNFNHSNNGITLIADLT